MIVGIVSGGFDPLHIGHVRMIQQAADQCERLIVGVNSDEWLRRKKGKRFMPAEERREIVSALRGVDEAVAFNDHDDSAVDLLVRVRSSYMHDRILFMNGGDRCDVEDLPFPERAALGRLNIEPVFGIGGYAKVQSSSGLIATWETTDGSPPL